MPDLVKRFHISLRHTYNAKNARTSIIVNARILSLRWPSEFTDDVEALLHLFKLFFNTIRVFAPLRKFDHNILSTIKTRAGIFAIFP